MAPRAGKRTWRPSGPTPTQLIPAPQTTATPQPALGARAQYREGVVGDREPLAPSRARRPPRAARAPRPAGRARRAGGGRRRRGAPSSPACASASARSRSSSARLPSSPRWCGELSPPRTSASSAPSSRTSARSVLELPPSTASTTRPLIAPAPRPAGARRSVARPSRPARSAGARAARCGRRAGCPTAPRGPPAARRRRRAAVRPSSSGASGAWGSGTGPSGPTRAGSSTTSSSASPASVPWLRTSTTCTPSPAPASEATIRSPPPSRTRRRAARAAPASRPATGRGTCSSSRRSISITSAARGTPSRCSAEHRVVLVEVAQVVGGHGAELVEQPPRQPDLLGQRVAVVGEQRAEHVVAVEPHRAHPGQVVEADLVDLDPLGRDAEQPRDVALEGDRHVAEPDRAVAVRRAARG